MKHSFILLIALCSLLFFSCSSTIQSSKCELIVNTMHSVALTICQFVNSEAAIKNFSSNQSDSLTTSMLLYQLHSARSFMIHNMHNPASFEYILAIDSVISQVSLPTPKTLSPH